MDTQFKRQYMLRMKLRYAKAVKRHERSALISEAVLMTGFSRKYVIRLLSGNRSYRKHKGRRPIYSKGARDRLVRIWLAMGQLCPKYLHAVMPKALQDYAEASAEIPPSIADELLRMSASTMERILRRHRFNHPRAANKRSGAKATIAAQIPAGPGALEETGEPGILQIDTVALCGGDLRESFFWILHITDAATQWDGLAPCWNRGAEATTRALAHLLERLPFPPKVIHVDNGSEFINHHLLAFLNTHHPELRITRSRPYHKNDNHRIEQKNGSIVRALFGDLRFDDYTQLPALTELCDQWSTLHNYAIPCTRQIAKTRRTDTPGLRYRRTIDTPRTPYERLCEHLPLPPPPPINAIQLRRTCERTLKRLFMTQHS